MGENRASQTRQDQAKQTSRAGHERVLSTTKCSAQDRKKEGHIHT